MMNRTSSARGSFRQSLDGRHVDSLRIQSVAEAERAGQASSSCDRYVCAVARMAGPMTIRTKPKPIRMSTTGKAPAGNAFARFLRLHSSYIDQNNRQATDGLLGESRGQPSSDSRTVAQQPLQPAAPLELLKAEGGRPPGSLRLQARVYLPAPADLLQCTESQRPAQLRDVIGCAFAKCHARVGLGRWKNGVMRSVLPFKVRRRPG